MKQFKRNLDIKFTYWYIKKGYIFGYDEYMNPFWKCPWWVRPFLIFFSPSIYFVRKIGGAFCTEFRKTVQEAITAVNK